MAGPIDKNFSSIDFFQSCYNAYNEAEQKTKETIDKFFNIAGYTIQLRFAGSALIPSITRAIQHLAIKPKSPADLIIYLWDSHATGIKIPSIYPLSDILMKQRTIYYPYSLSNSNINTGINPESKSLFILNNNTNSAIFGIDNVSKFTLYEQAEPLIGILHTWMSNHERQFLHAGVVGNKKTCVLLAGEGEAGKSTCSVICFEAGLNYLGDDYCIISTDTQTNNNHLAYSIYNSAKLRTNCLYKPIVKPTIQDHLKYLYFLHEYAPERIVSSKPIKAILLPQISNCDGIKLIPTTSATALKALAPSSIFQLGCTNHKSFRHIVNLVKTVPCYILKLGANIKEIPLVIKNLLNESI